MDFDFTTETITPDSTNILTIGGSGGIEISVGTTAERPVSPINGTVRYNTDDNLFEFYQAGGWTNLGNGTGTVTSVAASGGTTGLSFTGSPITTAGTLTLTGTLNVINGGTGQTTYTNGQLLIGNTTGNTLTKATLTQGTGIIVTNGAGSITIANAGVTSQTLTQPASGLTITNSGVAQTGAATNTFALANDLAAVEGLATTGLATRIGADTWTTRTITGTTNQITVTDGNGVAGNPTIAIADNPILPGTASLTLNSGTTAQRPATPVNGMIRYNTTLGYTEIYEQGSWYRVGTIVQGTVGILAVYTGVIPASSGTSAVPYDNTTPLVTEGSQIWTTTISPSKTTSFMKFTVPFTVDCDSNNRIVIASLFRGTLNIGSAVWYTTGGGRPTTITLSVSDSPNTTSPVTYSMRVGVGVGGATWFVNSLSSGNDLGGALISNYEITEVG